MAVNATRAQLLAALRVSGIRPCRVDRGNWYACRGDDDPTTGFTCPDGQCQNPDHDGRRPCRNPWHQFPPEVREELR